MVEKQEPEQVRYGCDASGHVGWRGNRVAKSDDVFYFVPPVCAVCHVPDPRDEARRVRRRRREENSDRDTSLEIQLINFHLSRGDKERPVDPR